MALKYEFFNGGPDPKTTAKDFSINRPAAGTSATEIDGNMRKEGWGGLFKSDQQRDHCKYLEKQVGREYTNLGRFQLKASSVDHLMSLYDPPDRG